MLILSVGDRVHAAAHNYLVDTKRSYFTIRLMNGDIKSFIPVLDSETKIKFRYKNKTYMLYKQVNLKYSIASVVTNPEDINDVSNKTLNWMGIYYEKNNIFYKNPNYNGDIFLYDIIDMIKL